MADCLNCRSELQGPFCSVCGQRAIAAYPTIRELIGDAWHELSGYDGRFMRTFRVLLGRPGALTTEMLEGRRVRYVSPIRLYLVASVGYFLCAAAIPNIRLTEPVVMPGSKVNIQIDASGGTNLSDENRERALRDIERAPWWIQKVMRPIVADPEGFRHRFLQTVPRVMFALVPVFAGIVALFFRGRRFTQHLIFAIHLQTAIFVMLSARELSQLVRSALVLVIFEAGAAVAIAVYGVLAVRAVYRETWPRTLVKSVAIAGMSFAAVVSALLVTVLWTAVLG
jgi:hypothetical protein